MESSLMTPTSRTRIYAWLLLGMGSLLSHWLYYNLLTSWLQTLARLDSRSVDGRQFGWLSVGLALWLWGTLFFYKKNARLLKSELR
ncbi:hypothetical protein [Spirosoma sordidisoli]|uniref:Uncharacterized protein n=1 Tax=Spirosoma sordidisoli TaxID=2502893 RepID=A0A4Q2UFX0_9BACT|nr:hypothetical protein [Spirosoma sordidisoli]RYC67896.1 hypothetical protein EQG79_20750 [Spirosoma sordidisoli]